MGQRSKMKKLMIILKRWQSFPRVARSYSNLSNSDPEPEQLEPFHDVHDWNDVTAPYFAEKRPSSLIHADQDYKVEEAVPVGYKALYIGKCRRRYFISAEYLNHPLLTELIAERFRDGFSVACEVVLFEHLVRMLETADPEAIQSDSTLEELAQFYASN